MSGPSADYVGAVGCEPGVLAGREIVFTDEFRQALALLAGGEHLFLTGKRRPRMPCSVTSGSSSASKCTRRT